MLACVDIQHILTPALNHFRFYSFAVCVYFVRCGLCDISVRFWRIWQESVEKELSASRENFAAEVNDFCKHYDLCSEHSHDAAPACQLMDDGAFNAQTRELADHVDQLQAGMIQWRRTLKSTEQKLTSVGCLWKWYYV